MGVIAGVVVMARRVSRDMNVRGQAGRMIRLASRAAAMFMRVRQLRNDSFDRQQGDAK
jgi:hypothetical protein